MVTTQEPAEQSTPPVQPKPAPARATRVLVLGVLAGLVVGAGGVGLAWGLSGGSDAAEDASAVCGIVLRTPDLPNEPDDITLEYTQRWAVSEVAQSLAAADSTYRPLADALRDVTVALSVFRLDEMRSAMSNAKRVCEDL
jgi:hypothetical protein